MMNSIIIFIITIPIIITIITLSGWLAGPTGILLGIFLAINILLNFFNYLNIIRIPNNVMGLLRWTAIAASTGLVAVWGTNTILKRLNTANATATNQNPILKEGRQTIILKIGKVWTRIPLPPEHWFRIDPLATIRIRLHNEKEYIMRPGGLPCDNGNENANCYSSLGDEIPGMELFIKAEEEETATVILVLWPK